MKKLLPFVTALIVITTSLSQAQNPTLWGITTGGGSTGGGTIYKSNAGGIETDLYNFSSGAQGQTASNSLIQANNGLLYGMTMNGGTNDAGSIFSYNLLNGDYTNLFNFVNEFPGGSLMQASNGLLYGVTGEGGTYNKGIIFSFNITSGKLNTLHSFGGDTDGLYPPGSLIQGNDSVLYGVTFNGGSIDTGYYHYGQGTIFSYNINSDKETVLHSFGKGSDGVNPTASLTQANDSLLYGMTFTGGTNFNWISSGDGTLFRYNINTGKETVVHDFGGPSDGAYVTGSPIKINDSLIYGQTTDPGTLFSYNINSNKESVVYSFTTSAPGGSLLLASNGLLYGTGYGGGAYAYGTIFSYNIITAKDSIIYNFTNTDGAYPDGNLIEVDTPISILFSVWPGDVNDDLTVNNYDLLPIGLYYGETGPARSTITNAWAGQVASNWDSLQSNGYDLKFVDCNGDGTINSEDTLAITLNYGLTHLQHSPRNLINERSGGAPLYFIADSSLYHAGSKVHVAVWLGNSTTPVTDIYGLGYDMTMDNSSIQAGTISFNYDNSFLGTKNTNTLSLTHIGSHVETAVTRITHNNVSGYGKIGDLYFILNSSINNPQLLLSFSSSQANDSAGNLITLQPANDTLAIKITTAINQLSLNNNQLSIYPNPTTGEMTIVSAKTIDEVTVTNLLGQTVLKSPSGDLGVTQFTFELKDDGMYFVTTTSGNEITTGKVVVNK